MSSSLVDRAENPNIMLGKSPERDREIDAICQMIRNAAKVGIPAVKYNLTLLGVVRTGADPGRGGARYSTFVSTSSRTRRPSTERRPRDEEMWERITYFLKRVVPVAEESKVRLCCHPHDPALPPGKAYRGVHRSLGTVEGLKTLRRDRAQPVSRPELLPGDRRRDAGRPGQGDLRRDPLVRQAGKIFNVHFRNIKGGFGNFQETFPDDGDVDMLRALRVYKEVGYDGMIMPDHAPGIDGDTGGAQAFAFAFGYIQGLIQAVYSEEA